MYQFPATCVSIHDADTVRVAVSPFPKGVACTPSFLMDVRLFGIDAPELATQPGKDALAALQAKLAGVQGVVPNGVGTPNGVGASILVELVGVEKYGRILGTIWADGVNINDWLVAGGYAKAYDGHGVKPWGPDGKPIGPAAVSRMLACGGPNGYAGFAMGAGEGTPFVGCNGDGDAADGLGDGKADGHTSVQPSEFAGLGDACNPCG